MESRDSKIVSNNWQDLKKFTDARISLGRAGLSVPTKELLDFQVSHARARDAVHKKFTKEHLISYFQKREIFYLELETNASSRALYLKNPDLGRRLSTDSIKTLQSNSNKSFDLAILIGDGLSARAVEENVSPFLEEFLKIVPSSWKLSPICLINGARVAVSDAVGELLDSELALLLIGERPGLSSPNSMGIYITYRPKMGKKDSERNCISNVRPEGLSYKEAALKSLYILEKAKVLKLTGVELKDDMKALTQKSG